MTSEKVRSDRCLALVIHANNNNSDRFIAHAGYSVTVQMQRCSYRCDVVMTRADHLDEPCVDAHSIYYHTTPAGQPTQKNITSTPKNDAKQQRPVENELVGDG